jgi:Mg2+ and Co2+ transporter CorA
MPSKGGAQLASVGFVLCADVLVTVRIDAAQIFDQFVAGFEKGAPADTSPASIATGLLEVMADALADRLEEIRGVLDGLATGIFRAEAPTQNVGTAMKIDSGR